MKSIQNYFSLNFNIDNNTSATILITLLVFLCGILATWFAKFIYGFITRKENRKLLIILVDQVVDSNRKQSLQFNNAWNRISIESYKTGLGMKRASFHFSEILNQLGYNNCYFAFFNGVENIPNRLFKNSYKLKAFMKLWEIINACEFWVDKAFNDAENIFDKINYYGDLRNEALDNFRKIIDRYKIEWATIGVSHDHLQYIVELDSILVNWQNAKDCRTPFVAQNQLIEPTLKLNRKFQNLSIILEINDYLLKASFYYENMQNCILTFRKQFVIYSANFRCNYRLLEVAIKGLN